MFQNPHVTRAHAAARIAEMHGDAERYAQIRQAQRIRRAKRTHDGHLPLRARLFIAISRMMRPSRRPAVAPRPVAAPPAARIAEPALFAELHD